MHSSHLSSGSTCNCSEELSVLKKQAFELEKSSNPGFVISFDDLDIQLQRKIGQWNQKTGITTG